MVCSAKGTPIWTRSPWNKDRKKLIKESTTSIKVRKPIGLISNYNSIHNTTLLPYNNWNFFSSLQANFTVKICIQNFFHSHSKFPNDLTFNNHNNQIRIRGISNEKFEFPSSLHWIQLCLLIFYWENNKHLAKTEIKFCI